MRLKPVAATGTTRIAARDLVLGEHTIPADTLLWVPFDAIHHSELNYEDAGKFKPVCISFSSCFHVFTDHCTLSAIRILAHDSRILTSISEESNKSNIKFT